MKALFWRPSREWDGRTCFIIGGGPSVKNQNIDALKSHRTIVINTSYTVAPWAHFLIFSDARWWGEYYRKVDKCFGGRIVSASTTSRHPRLFRMERQKLPGLAKDIGTVQVNYTTATAAINLAVHLGVNKIVLLGLDGKHIVTGKTDKGKEIILSHHHEPHPWKQLPGCWDRQKKDLTRIAADLVGLKIDCVNASPDSAYDLWPKVSLEDCLRNEIEATAEQFA